jgi:hypothetical protein
MKSVVYAGVARIGCATRTLPKVVKDMLDAAIYKYFATIFMQFCFISRFLFATESPTSLW